MSAVYLQINFIEYTPQYFQGEWEENDIEFMKMTNGDYYMGYIQQSGQITFELSRSKSNCVSL